MEGLKVKCPNCRIIRHETTEYYVPDQTPNGSFVRLIEPWKSWRWSCFDEEGEGLSTTPCAMMTCPECAAPLAPTGRLTVLPPEEKGELGNDEQEKINACRKKAIDNLPKGDPASFWVKKQKDTPKWVCKICGKVCKSKAGLGSHMRVHKDKV